MKCGRSTTWLLVATLLVGGCQQPPRFDEQDRATVAGMFDSTLSYFRAKNFTAWAALYSDDGLVMPPNARRVRGRAALLEWASAFPAVEQVSFSDVQVAGEGNMAYGTSGYVLKLQGLPADSGKQLVIFRRTAAGRWEAVAGAFNSDIPLATAPEQPSGRR